MDDDVHTQHVAFCSKNLTPQWWRYIFDAILDPVAFLDVEGTMLYANCAMARYLELSLSEIVGVKCHQLFHHSQQHIQGCPLVRSKHTRQRETMEMLVNDKYFFVVVDPVLAPDGNVEGFIHIVRNITELKNAQRQLAEQANLLQIAASTSQFGGWSVDLKTQRVRWSNEVARIHEVEPDFSPTIDEGISFYTPECQIRIREVFTRCAQEGVPYNEDMEIITVNGRRVAVRTCGVPVRDESGNIVGVQGSFQDISEWKRVEEERRQLHNQLLVAQKIESVGRLASGIAHDFNNLLAVVLGYLGFALDEVPSDSSLHHDLIEVQKAAERAAHLTRQLLAFSRKQVFSMQVMELNTIVSGIENMLRRLLGEDIIIILDLHPETGTVRVDLGQMEQVIMNLAVNARDAMPHGGKLIIQTNRAVIDETYTDVHIKLPAGSYAVLSITDTGCGMAPNIIDRIFDPFFTTKEKDKGTGLGLSIVHGIVSQFGGYIWVYSEVGKGTTFKLYLPIVKTDNITSNHTMQRHNVRGNETILLVEDEPAVRDLAERMLIQAGYTVIKAAGKNEAMVLANRFLSEIDLLITDVIMPHINGRELSEILRIRRPCLKTLFISGYPRDVTVEWIGNDCEYLEKPFSSLDLTRKVRNLLDQK